VGELKTNCRLLALVRKKVVLQDLELNQSRVELLMNYKTQEYNIAEAFTSGGKPEEANEGGGKATWVITVNRGKLFSTHFQMTDSVSGIHILQDISEAGLKKFTLSLPAGFPEINPSRTNEEMATRSSSPLKECIPSLLSENR